MSPWRQPLRWPLLLLLLTVAGGWLLSDERAQATAFVGRLALGLLAFQAVYFYLTTAFTDGRLRRTLWTLTAALAGLLVLTLIGTRWPAAKFLLPLDAIYQRLPTLLTDTLHPNVAAAGLLLLLPIPCVLFLDDLRRPRSPWARGLSLAVSLLTLFVLLLTQSRAAWLALAGMALAAAFHQVQRAWLRWLLIVLSAAAAGLLLWLARAALAADWLNRQMVWAQGLAMLQDFGLTGIGPGSFGALGPQLYADFWMGDLSFVAPHAHNLFLQVGIDLGIAGLTAYLALLATAAALASSAWRHRPAPLVRLTAGAVLLSLLALVLDGLLDIGVWGSQGGFIAWIVLGLAGSLTAARSWDTPPA